MSVTLGEEKRRLENRSVNGQTKICQMNVLKIERKKFIRKIRTGIWGNWQ